MCLLFIFRVFVSSLIKYNICLVKLKQLEELGNTASTRCQRLWSQRKNTEMFRISTKMKRKKMIPTPLLQSMTENPPTRDSLKEIIMSIKHLILNSSPRKEGSITGFKLKEEISSILIFKSDLSLKLLLEGQLSQPSTSCSRRRRRKKEGTTWILIKRKEMHNWWLLKDLRRNIRENRRKLKEENCRRTSTWKIRNKRGKRLSPEEMPNKLF